jgi:hypothetical protein
VRVPVYIVILLVVALVGGLWWQGTRKYDFVSPPDEATLAAVREEASREFASLKPAGVDLPKIDIETPPSTAVAIVEPTFDPGDIETAPGLNSYAVESQQGAAYLVKLATALEQKGAFPRALLAWERVLDMGKAEPEFYRVALDSIKRLRPTLPPWNIDPEATLPIVIRAGTGPDAAEVVKPVLEAVARDITLYSGGILTVTTDLTVGKQVAGASATAPVAVWLSGPAKDSPATAVISFTLEHPKEAKSQILSSVYDLVRGYLRQKTAYVPLPDRPLDEDPAQAVQYRVTRLGWRELGTLLNTKTPPPAR